VIFTGRFLSVILMAGILSASAGCSGPAKPSLQQIQADWAKAEMRGLSLPAFDSDVEAVCDPPIGWKADPLKKSPNHIHKTWLSPTGQTSYGVIHFKMPLPAGNSVALTGFMSQMKKTEGEATLISHQDDDNLRGIRFVAEGGLYKIRANLIADGWEGWVVYEGTLRKGQPIDAEIDLATRAREHTSVGKPN
jgi:hypothetical protein